MNPEVSPRRRIVVTGMGVISPLGISLEAFWNACVGRVSGVKPYDAGGTEQIPLRIAAPATGFTGNISDFGVLEGSLKKDIRKSLKLMSREIQMGVASAQRALQNAHIHPGDLDPARVGVSYGSDYIITSIEELTAGVHACSDGDHFNSLLWPSCGMSQMTPLWQLKFLTNMITSHISILNQFHGIGCNVTNRESSACTLISEAFEIMQRGHLDVMVVGAAGSRLHPLRIVSSLRSESLAADPDLPPEEASRPYDLDRTGGVLGEGAGGLVLEELEHAQKRNAPIYAEILGGASSAVISRNPNSAEGSYFEIESYNDLLESMTLTLQSLQRKVGRSFDSVGHINAQGASTKTTDAAESTAIRNIFGNAADSIPVTTIKGHTGNSGAGGDAADLIASILALKNGQLFPILNNKTNDPACPIVPVREDGVPSGDSFVKTGCHLFGQTSALWISRWDS